MLGSGESGRVTISGAFSRTLAALRGRRAPPRRAGAPDQQHSNWRLFPGGVVGLGRDALLLGGKQNRASGQERGFFAVGGVDGQVGGAAQHH